VGLGVVYTRTIQDSVLTLSASGWTYNNVFVLYDYQTESLWYPMTDQVNFTTPLVCVSGFFADEKLAEIPSTKTIWQAWKSSQPNTKFMKP